MSDNQESASSPLATFMQKKSGEKNNGAGLSFKGTNKTQESLKKAKEKEKEAKEKELFEAKKESAYKASRYDQSHVTNKRVKETGVMYVVAVVIALLILLAVIKIIPALATGVGALLRGMIKIK